MTKRYLELLIALSLCLMAIPSIAATEKHVIATGALGKGAVTLWQQGTNLGATIDAAALASLPDKETVVDLQGAGTEPFELVEVDWHPHGHPPEHVYDVPHFDVHFYTIAKSERDAIVFAPPGAQPKPAKDLVPEAYVTDGHAEPRMGVHWVPAATPEFHGQPFTYTQVWGYNNGHFAFVEPMFTQAFVKAGSKRHDSSPHPAGIKVALPSTVDVGPNAAGGYDVILSK